VFDQGKPISAREWLFITLAPFVAVPLFGICLINQDGFVDPWFYTGYGRLLKSLVAIHGWTYYSIRFPVISLISFFSTVFKEPLDFIILRYVLYLVVALVLYRFNGRTFGKGAAVAAVATLLAAPQFGRVVLWDLTSFVAIPAVLIAMCFWLGPAEPRFWPRLGAGFMFGVAATSHVFVASAIATFLLVQFVMDCCGGGWRQFAASFAWALLGGAVCIAMGLIYYNVVVGSFGPKTLFAVTLASIRGGLEYHQNVQLSTAQILEQEFPIYVPLLLTAMNAVLLGKKVLSTNISARIFWFSAAYILFFAIFHFVAGRNVLGFFWYAAFLFPVVILQIPSVVSAAAEWRWNIWRNPAIAFILALVIFPLLNNWVPAVSNMFHKAQGSSFTVIILLVLAAGSLFLAIGSWWVSILRPAAAVMLAVFVQVAFFSNSAYSVVFTRSFIRKQFAVYGAAADLVRLARVYNKPGHRMRIWYPRGDTSMAGLSFVILGSTIQTPFGVFETGMPSIGDTERQTLGAPDTAYVLLSAQSEDMIEAGMAALQSAGFPFKLEAKTVLGTGSFQEKAVLIALQR